MFAFSPDRYGSAIASLLDVSRPDSLGPGKPNLAAKEALRGLSVERAFAGQPVIDSSAARCCISGLWLLHNFLDESHTISQEIETAGGSYWHAVMHRREPDYGNAKYWFRRVGSHPIFGPLLAETQRLVSGHAELDPQARLLADGKEWDPYRFVDLCEHVGRSKSSAGEFCLQVARIEWQLLFDHCYGEALGR